jgi:hypothetical protein
MATMEATAQALDLLLRAAGDPLAELHGIDVGHPEFHRAQVLRAGAGVLAKTPAAFPGIVQAIEAAGERDVAQDVRAHLGAAQAWVRGNPVLAAERYASILNTWPHDLLALRLAQSCYFFLGWHERLCWIVDAVMRAWSAEEEGFDFVLAMAAFVHAEHGDAAYAEALGRQALAKDPACPLGVHSVAHAIAEAGRPRHGAQWMREQHAHWARESRMRTHNAWHLAMFDAEDGNVGSALRILDAWLLPATAESQLDACDATALLWRLEREGVECAGRWQRVSDAFDRTLTPGFWPFVDLHAALAHLSAKKHTRMRALVHAIEHCAQGTSYAALRARHITQPGVRALVAWSEGRYGEAAADLAGLRPKLSEAGGSSVQLEVFKHIERAASVPSVRVGPPQRPDPILHIPTFCPA